MDNNFAIESFIEYCDSMMIVNEGFKDGMSKIVDKIKKIFEWIRGLLRKIKYNFQMKMKEITLKKMDKKGELGATAMYSLRFDLGNLATAKAFVEKSVTDACNFVINNIDTNDMDKIDNMSDVISKAKDDVNILHDKCATNVHTQYRADDLLRRVRECNDIVQRLNKLNDELYSASQKILNASSSVSDTSSMYTKKLACINNAFQLVSSLTSILESITDRLVYAKMIGNTKEEAKLNKDRKEINKKSNSELGKDRNKKSYTDHLED